MRDIKTIINALSTAQANLLYCQSKAVMSAIRTNGLAAVLSYLNVEKKRSGEKGLFANIFWELLNEVPDTLGGKREATSLLTEVMFLGSAETYKQILFVR